MENIILIYNIHIMEILNCTKFQKINLIYQLVMLNLIDLLKEII